MGMDLRTALGRARARKASLDLAMPAGALVVAYILTAPRGPVVAGLAVAAVLGPLLIGLAMPLAALVGPSRIYLGAHDPTDVPAGWSAGLSRAPLCWLAAHGLR